jgi:phosphatidate cytidylyltransferase
LRLYIPSHLADSTPPTAPATPETAAATPAGPSNLRLRIIYGLIGAALLLGSVWFSPWTFGIFFAAVQAVMLWEFYRMMRAGGYAPATWIGVVVSLIIYAAIYVYHITGLCEVGYGVIAASNEQIKTSGDAFVYHSANGNYVVTAGDSIGLGFASFVGWIALIIVALLPIMLLLREMYWWSRGNQSSSSFPNVAVSLLGLFYITIPMGALNVLAFAMKVPNPDILTLGASGYDYRRIFALLFLIWASDIGAYAAGKTFGKHKMAPQISPGKTWEGWAGGFVLTLVVGWAVGFMLPDMPLSHRLVAAGVVAVFAPLGDLAESMLKRSVGVKDSGSIMPGHGGLLDRFDAFLLVLPVLALLQLLAG